VKDRILHVWEQRRAEANERTEAGTPSQGDSAETRSARQSVSLRGTIDLTSYERQRDKLREELTLTQIDHDDAESIDELDVHGILAFAERISAAHQTCGCRPLATTSSDCGSCSSWKEARSTGIDSIEPPQRHPFSATWRRPRVLMKGW
jgi:hypothetical protein